MESDALKLLSMMSKRCLLVELPEETCVGQPGCEDFTVSIDNNGRDKVLLTLLASKSTWWCAVCAACDLVLRACPTISA